MSDILELRMKVQSGNVLLRKHWSYRKNPHSYLLNKTWEDEIIENLTDFVDESLKEKERIVQRRYELQMQQMKKERENAPTDNEWDDIKTTLNDWKK